ncbi:MAG: hypothetical protein E6H67_06865 [Betaproteobacteria bacterium]|nr:MAG: hypothetical protein E6H67_06865 [Betaproteobacteria bacterium]
MFTSSPPPNGVFNLAYSFGVTASGTPAPTFSVPANALPPGLGLQSVAGVISGIPSASGTFAGTLTATNGVPPDATQTFAVTINQANQTITFNPPGNQTIVNPPFTISATASSGLPISFASLTPSVCTVNGNTVFLVAIGPCTIRSSQAGNANYSAAPNVNQSFQVTATNTSGSSNVALASAGAVASASSSYSAGYPVAAVNNNERAGVNWGTGGGWAAASAPPGWVQIDFNGAKTIDHVVVYTLQDGYGAPVEPTDSLTFSVYGITDFTVQAWDGSTWVTLGSVVGNNLVKRTVSFAAYTTPRIRVNVTRSLLSVPTIVEIEAWAVGSSGTSQTITFNAPDDQAFGVAPFALAATASSNLPVSFTSLTTAVCTVSGATVTIIGAGTCTIQSSQSGNANYSAAPNVSQSFTVTSVLQSQTITFGALSNQTFGAAPFTVSATASSGLLVNFASLTTPVCMVGGSTVTLVSAGTCIIQASQAGNATYAAAPNVNQSFSVTLSSHTLSFAPAVNYATGTFPESLALGDFNGDGTPDLAVANAFSANVSILIGHTDGTFAPGTTVASGGTPVAVAVGDFNGDGKLDLAVCDFTSGSVIIFSGNSNGTFTRVGSFSSGLYPDGLGVADVNRDGKLDLVIVNNTSGNTTGQTVTVLLGNGDGSFRAPVSYPTGTSPAAVVVADFNGDGKPDLAVANFGSNTVSILMGNGDGTFAAAVNYTVGNGPDGLAVGDFNGDGKLDLAVVNDYSGNVSIFLGRGDGTFGAAINFATGYGSASVAVADFNGDGWADLAVVNRFDNTMVVLLGNGNGTFQGPLTYGVGGQAGAIVAKDLNGDGKPDLVVTSAANNNISVLLQTSGVPPANLSVQSGSPQSAAVGTVYATLFAVLVQDAGGHPLPGVAITFAAPATGASGAFSGAGTVAQAASNVSGVATAPAFTANSIGGAFTVIASYSGSTASFALANTTSTQAPQFTSSSPPNGTYGIPYAFTLTASGVPPPVFGVVGALPQGLTLNATTGAITGTPILMGNANGGFTTNNGVGTWAIQPFNILIAPRITFGALNNQPLGTPPFAVTATASSGLPVTFTSLTPTVCTINGSMVTLVAAGTCTIRASQAGDATYSAATNVDQSFAVMPILANQITFGALNNRTFGAGPFAISHRQGCR